jgi:hypothetical protein
MSDQQDDRKQMEIVDGSEHMLPVPRSVAVVFAISDVDGNAIVPDTINSISIYRISKSRQQQETPSAYAVFQKSSFENQDVWSSYFQGWTDGVVASGLAEIDIPWNELQDNAAHDPSTDILLVDGVRIPITPSMFSVTVSGSPPVNHVSIDLAAVCPDGTEFEYIWSKRAFDMSVSRIGLSTFMYSFDGSAVKFGPGSYFSIIDFTVGDDTGSSAIEFHLEREQTAAFSSLEDRKEKLDRTMDRKLPFFLFDREDGDFKTTDIVSFINSFLAAEADLIDGINYAWDPLMCPVMVLEYIAAEWGMPLVGADPVLWRRQVINVADRMKRRGSIEGLRRRLDDCGATLVDFARHFQVRPAKFNTEAWIVDSATESTMVLPSSSQRTWIFKLAKKPWFFPAGAANDPEVPYVILELRGDGETRWHTLPTKVNRTPLIRFFEEGGEWKAAVSLHRIDVDANPPVVEDLVPPFAIDLYDEVRITYPTAPWGLVPIERDFIPEAPAPHTLRSGIAAGFNYDVGKHVFIGDHPFTGSVALFEWDEVMGIKTVIETDTRPPARRGFACMQYTEERIVLFGGITDDGRRMKDTWILAWDGSSYSWRECDAPGPSARSGMCALEAQTAGSLKSFFIHGGEGDYGTLADTWQWNPIDETWLENTYPYVSRAYTLVSGSVVVGAELSFTSASAGAYRGQVYLFEDGEQQFLFRVDSVVTGFTETITGIVLWINDTITSTAFTAQHQNRYPSRRCGAQSLSIVTNPLVDDQSFGFMYGGWSDKDGPLDELWAINSSGVWNQIWPDNGTWITSGSPGDPVRPEGGHASVMVRDHIVSGPVEEYRLFIGSGSPDGLMATDRSKMPLGRASRFRLEGINGFSTMDNVVAEYRKVDDDPESLLLLMHHTLWMCSSTSFDDNHKTDIFAVSFDFTSGIQSARNYQIIRTRFDNGTLLLKAETAWTPYEDNIPDVLHPVTEPGRFEVAADAGPYRVIEVSGNRMDVTSPDMVRDTWSFPVSAPLLRTLQSPLEDTRFWNIVPATALFSAKRIPIPVGSDTSSPPARHDFIVRFSELNSIASETTAEERVWCPVCVEGVKYILMVKIVDADDRLIGHVAVDESGSVTCASVPSVPTAITASWADGILSLNTFSVDALKRYELPRIEMRWRSGYSQLPPLVGGYARVDDRLFQFVAAPSGSMPELTLIDVSGNEIVLDRSDFAFAHDPGTGKSEIWIKSLDEPDLTEIVSAKLYGFFPARRFVIGPSIWRNTVSWRAEVDYASPDSLPLEAVLAAGHGITEDLAMQPAVVWGDLDDLDGVNFKQVAEHLRFRDGWEIRLSRPDGSSDVINVSLITVTRIFDMMSNATSVLVMINPEGLHVPKGSIISIAYPLDESVILRQENSDPLDWQRWPTGDYFGDNSLYDLAEVAYSSDKTTVTVKSATVVSRGFSDNVIPMWFTGARHRLRISSATLVQRSFRDRVSYRPTLDPAWMIDGSILWASHALASVFADDPDPSETTPAEYGFDAIGSIPRYSPIHSLNVLSANGMISHPVTLAYPVATIESETELNELLHISLLQGRVPAEARSVAGLADWLDLYIMSLPLADTRTIDKLATYTLWRSQIAAGQTPTVVPSPRVDHMTRLIDTRDANLAVICSDRNPFPGTVNFGMVRSMVPYGQTVFNEEEYDGSTRPSTDPCDIDESFIEPCSCAPASHIGYIVTVPMDAKVSVSEINAVIADMLPAHAVMRFANYRLGNKDDMTTAEALFMKHGRHIAEAMLSFDPRLASDGSVSGYPSWHAMLDWSFTPYYENDHWIQEDTSYDREWRLHAPEASVESVPFASGESGTWPVQDAFALIAGRTIRMRGIKRLGRSDFLFKTEYGGEPPATSDYEIWNTSVAQATATVTEIGRYTWIKVDGLDPSLLYAGMYMIFWAGPIAANALDGLPAQYAREILQVVTASNGTWCVIDEDDFYENMPEMLSSYTGPKAVSIARTASFDSSEIIDLTTRAHTDPSASHAGKLSIDPPVPMRGFDTPQTSATFNLVQRCLRRCFLLSNADLVEYADLLSDPSSPFLDDPSGIGTLSTGDRVDFIGSLWCDGVRVCDFVVVDGFARWRRVTIGGSPAMSIIVLSMVVSDDRTLSMTFSSVIRGLTVRNVKYVAADSMGDAEVAVVRATASVIARSTDRTLDRRDGQFIFFEWQDAPEGWTRGGILTPRNVRTMRAESTTIRERDAKIGDSIFLDQDDFMMPREISFLEDAGSTRRAYFDVIDDLATVFVASQDVLLARFVASSISAAGGEWDRVARYVVLGVDLTSVMPPGYAAWTDIPANVILRIKASEQSVSIVEAQAGLPGTSVLKLDRPLSVEEEPFSPVEDVEVTIFDPEESLKWASTYKGGELVKVRHYDLDGQLVGEEEFRG